jgi:AraC family transcriptional regulator
MRETAASLGLNADGITIAPQLHLKDTRIEHLCWGLLGELESDAPFGRLYAESLACALAIGLLKNYVPKVPARPVGLPKRHLTRVLDYIRENISRDLSLAELAGIARVSPSHFKVLFKTAVGLPVHQYVINARIDRALHLIVHTNDALGDIALQSGFANQSHLSRHMRRLHGVSPATLRKQAR